MRVSGLLKASSILLRADVTQPTDALGLLVELQEKSGLITNGTAYYNALCARENAGTTAIGAGIALPHACSAGAACIGISALTLSHGADWGASDDRPVDLLFMIAVPPGAQSERLQILARLVTLLSDPVLPAALRRSANREHFLRQLTQAESDRFAG